MSTSPTDECTGACETYRFLSYLQMLYRERPIFCCSIMTAVVALMYALSLTTPLYGDQPGIPWSWSRIVDNNVLWDFDHEIDTMKSKRPLVIAHRGYSGAMPEETVEAYEMAVLAGADIIECDASLTKDLVVICTHDSWLNETTNIAGLYSSDRISEHFVPDATGGKMVSDYFSFDFTIEELKNLTKVEPKLFRDQNNNGLYKIATLEEMIKVAQKAKNPVGIHVEIKDPILINNATKTLHNKKFEDVVLDVLHSNGYKEKRSPCFIQCFDENSLKYIATKTSLPLVLLLDYPANVSKERLKDISKYAYGIGPDKQQLVAVNSSTNKISSRSDLAKISHELGLRLHVYTFRNEYQYLAKDYRQDPYHEYADFFRLSIDGYFTDFPDTLKNFLDSVYLEHNFSHSINFSDQTFTLRVSLLLFICLMKF